MILRDLKRQPADLLSFEGVELASECSTVVEKERIRELLARGFLLSQALEQWRARAIWVISRADSTYPSRLKARMRADAPPLLYGCGSISLLETGGLAVVGPRKVGNSEIEYARMVGKLAAQAGKPIVSGGAKGVDQAAMQGVLEAGGYGCEVHAEDLFKASIDRSYRDALMSERLLLISPYDPSSSFSVGHAMQRNKLIYAMADAALVVNSDLNAGGTWAGASEQLEKFHFVPVFVRSQGQPSLGLSALQERGAISWPEPQDVLSFKNIFEKLDVFRKKEVHLSSSELVNDLFANPPQSKELDTVGAARLSVKRGDRVDVSSTTTATLGGTEFATHVAADTLFNFVRDLLLNVEDATLSELEVAEALDVMPAQARCWLERLANEGTLVKHGQGTYKGAKL
ncbi:DNA-processing protein DprA [Rugamonas rubra]|uniref:DNA-processing protein DprA n=1 Tax=Rugamonas rubra TaxID=758825 RepID=UPI001FE3D430|nr:DNA-processing protein DprA [Rugamonas rubra]